ncbi:MAG: hypothetical protein AB1523_00230 [Bacillota bacterium]
MIDYAETQVGDILRIVGAGAPGYAKNGDLVRVLEVHKNSVIVENRDGLTCEFIFNCGAARLEPTEWKNDFPPEDAS